MGVDSSNLLVSPPKKPLLDKQEVNDEPSWFILKNRTHISVIFPPNNIVVTPCPINSWVNVPKNAPKNKTITNSTHIFLKGL
jgi:hypothetical protein